MEKRVESENPFLTLYMRVLSRNLDVLSSSLSRLFMEGKVWTTIGQDLQLRVLEEDELYIAPDHKANIGNPMARTPYVTVRGPEPAPPAPKEVRMADEYPRRELNPNPVPQQAPVKKGAKEEEDPRPERYVVPIEELDKIEKLLDVSVQTVSMPNLKAIQQACMEELAQINAAMAEGQQQAQEAYMSEMAEWEARQKQKADAKKAEEEKEA